MIYDSKQSLLASRKVKIADVEAEYKKNANLRKQDVEHLRNWVEKQPHLPQISELQLILFLQSCYGSIEQAKSTIDNYYTLKTLSPEIFGNRNRKALEDLLKVIVIAFLPQSTPTGETIIFIRFMETESNRFVVYDQLKKVHMSILMGLNQVGSSNEFVAVIDLTGVVFGHLTKLKPIHLKKFFFYLQESIPLKFKAFHFINVVPFMDIFLALIKPFMKSDFFNMIHVHSNSIESLFEYVPQKCLPKDYGGAADSVQNFHDKVNKDILDNMEYIENEEKEITDESKRIGKLPVETEEIFGLEGYFKKLDID